MERQTQLQKDLSESHWTEFDNSGTTNNNMANKDKVVNQMIENSTKWRESKDPGEREKLAKENQELGNSISAYYDNKTGRWYTDQTKKIPLYHKGLEYGQVGTGLAADEIIAKLTKKEWVFTETQMSNLVRNTNGMVKSRTSKGDLTISKLFDVVIQGNVDKDVDIENIIKRASDYTLGQLENKVRNMGFL